MTARPTTRSRALGLLALVVPSALALASCEDGAHHACAEIVQTHVPHVRAIIDDDLQRGLSGVTQAAELVARGFLVEDPAQRSREMQWAIAHRIREPPRGIPELMISPISFVAAVNADGHVLVRDNEDTRPMAGFDAGGTFPHVHEALTNGTASYQLVEFAGATAEDETSVSVLYVAPARVDGRIVGAIIAGTPLWRTAQRVTRQIQAEGVTDHQAIFWVYMFRGDRLFHHGTPPDLDTMVPDQAMREAGFARSSGGFCGEQQQYGRWYCYGAIHLPQIGDDVGAIIYYSDPVD